MKSQTWDSIRRKLQHSFDNDDLGHEVFRQAWIWSYRLERQGQNPPKDMVIDEDLDCVTWETEGDGIWLGEFKIYQDCGELAARDGEGEIVVHQIDPIPSIMRRTDLVY